MFDKKKTLKEPLVSVLIVLAGMMFLSVCYICYVLIVVLLENTIYHHDPASIPIDSLRNGLALTLLFLSFLLLLSKANDVFKVIVLMGALCMMDITMIFRYYEQPVFGILIISVLTGLALLIAKQVRKPTYYGVMILMAYFISLLYAWPR